MLSITVDPIVLQTLKQAFPKASSAQRALDKYIKLLSDQLTNSVLHGRSAWMESNNMYSISVNKQRHRGSQIGPSKIRLQNWLEANDLELFKVSTLGSNLSKKLSVVRLNDLITVTQTVAIYKTPEDEDTDYLKTLLQDQSTTNKQLFDQLFPEVQTQSEDATLEMFDIVPIDMKSLNNYMHWLSHDCKYIDARTKALYVTQADTIMRIAQHTGGFFFQRKKSSSFGRNYYAGTSVQNVNKELRRAMLGHCWEYDIRSAVFSWKMGFARECYEQLKTSETFEKTFSVTLNYLNDKKDFMMTVRHYTFTEDSEIPKEEQDKKLKQAVTAISFGARRGTIGWVKDGNAWKNPALVDIFKNDQDRKRFMNCSVTKKFIQEQNLIDNFIYKTCRDENPPFMQSDEVRTNCGLLSKAKVIAYLYQHFETEVMDVAAHAIESLDRKVLARIHDAIIIDKKLGTDNKLIVEEAMRLATGNPYWHLTMKELEPFQRPYSMDRDEILAHKKRITDETLVAEAAQKSGLFTSIFNWIGELPAR